MMARFKDTPVSEVPEVQEYMDAKEMLQAFMDNHRTVFESYGQLIDTMKQKMEAADKIVRAKEISCGDWELYQYQTKVDAEALFNAVGMEQFLHLGGSTSTKTVYEADKAKIEAAIARREISPELAADVLKKSARFHAPKDG